jgi:hypothetical protein
MRRSAVLGNPAGTYSVVPVYDAQRTVLSGDDTFSAVYLGVGRRTSSQALAWAR